MQESKWRKRIRVAAILLLCAVTALMDFFTLRPFMDEWRNELLSKIIQQAFGSAAAILLMRHLQICAFKKIDKAWYLLPCLLVAVDNLQWSALFGGKMQIVRTDFLDGALFALSCISVGLFEELVFRGVLFSLLLGAFRQNKKGLWQAYITSSALFGAAHLFNGFSLGTLLQVAYTILTGGLFAFCFLKTKNICCCALVHATYNFCGTLFDTRGLGSGVVFDTGTVITMLLVSVSVGVFVLYKVWKYPDEEREILYERLGIQLEENA